MTATTTRPTVDDLVAESEAAVTARSDDERRAAGSAPSSAEERLAERRIVRHLVAGDGDPDAPFEIPDEASFEAFDESEYEPAVLPNDDPHADPELVQREFQVAPELERIGKALIRHCDEFEPIRSSITIAWYWKRQGGLEYGEDRLGGCRRLTNLEREKVGADFVVWLAADHLGEGITSAETIERLLYHQVSHAGIHWKTHKPRTKPHHFAGFWGEEKRYGTFSAEIERRANQPVQSQLELNGHSDEAVPEGGDA